MPAKKKKSKPSKKKVSKKKVKKAAAKTKKKATKKRPVAKKKTKKVSKSSTTRASAKKAKAANTVFIVNPKSAGGRTQKRWGDIENLLLKSLDDFDYKFTEDSGHATILAREAIAAGAEKIIAVGGDGTISEVSAGFFDAKGKLLKKPGKNAPALGILAAGSGSDFIKTVNIPKEIEPALQVIASGNTKVIDMGLVTFQNKRGAKETRPFINIAEVGVGGEVVDIVQSGSKSTGALTYQIASLKGLLRYKPSHTKVEIDKNIKREGKLAGVIVCNGRFFGGGMKVAPHAEVNDGLFDVIILGELNRFETILKMGKVRSGKHIYEDGVEVARASNIKVAAEGKCLLDLDGEGPGQCPVEFQIVPAAINLIVP